MAPAPPASPPAARNRSPVTGASVLERLGQNPLLRSAAENGINGQRKRQNDSNDDSSERDEYGIGSSKFSLANMYHVVKGAVQRQPGAAAKTKNSQRSHLSSGNTTATDAAADTGEPRWTRSGGLAASIQAAATKNTSNNTAGGGNNKERPPVAGELVLDRFIEEAEYECTQDSYRGMAAGLHQANNNPDATPSPWMQCQMAIPSRINKNDSSAKSPARRRGNFAKDPVAPSINEVLGKRARTNSFDSSPTAQEEKDDDLVAQRVVQELCGCHCPSLTQWTKERLKKHRQQQKRRKKRRTKSSENNIDLPVLPVTMVGQRPDEDYDDDNKNKNKEVMRCTCDYNPYCLVSLGGVMNQLLQDQAQTIARVKQQQREDYQALVRAQLERDAQEENNAFRKGGVQQKLQLYPKPKEQDDADEFISDPESPDNIKQDTDKHEQKRSHKDCSPQIIVVDDDEDHQDSNDIKDDGDEKPAKQPHAKKQLRWDDSTIDLSNDNDVVELNGDSNYTNDASCPEYSPELSKDLAILRKSTIVDSQPIRDYLTNILHVANTTLEQTYEVDQLMEIFTRWQSDLVFLNPLEDAPPPVHPSEKLLLATPPGISNLGATCYLNTQLQCLAQNKAFWHGIVSWKAPNSITATTNTAAAANKRSPNTKANNPATVASPMDVDDSQDGENPNATATSSANVSSPVETNMSKGGDNAAEKSAVEVHEFDVDDDDARGLMNSVLSQLQVLLTKLVEGSDRTVDTLEFSKALGLENDEQQDPNEFARLLFERMHEAFQRTVVSTSQEEQASQNGHRHDLATLLPDIFEGETTYETTCSYCNSRSTRREKFMDLNLPIVKPPEPEDSDDTTRKGGSKVGTILNYFQKVFTWGNGTTKGDIDTDLQYCLDKYSSEELLDEDNQYFCGTCECKRDAIRVTNLTSLPPVLNVQLSRYVFDREKLVKKKLTDKVVLPRVLSVQTKESDSTGDAFKTGRYILCAVMKHQGSSAYRGHYVAEAMDWLSGQWFEFNDEKVSLLENGPSCSYMPSDSGHILVAEPSEPADSLFNCTGSNKWPPKIEAKESEASDAKVSRRGGKLVGSSDAYNMYYVEEAFLATQVVQSLDKVQERQQVSSLYDDIRGGIAYERKSWYRRLNDLCLKDGAAGERLKTRTLQVRSDLLALPAASQAVGSTKGPEQIKAFDFVWVEGDQLRRFVSGKDRLDHVFRTDPGEPLLRHKQFLCNHDQPGLHPRVARRGKLLPRGMYDTYVRLLASERTMSLEQENGASAAKKRDNLSDNGILNDCLITPTQNLYCKTCEDAYRQDLKEKLKLALVLRELYSDLVDPDAEAGELGKSVFDFKYDDDNDNNDEDDYKKIEDEQFLDCPEDRYAYIVPRKFIKSFRGRVEKLMKGLADVESVNWGNRIDCIAEGLDSIDLTPFQADTTDDGNSAEKDALDLRINGSITCQHGNCVEKKRSTKLLSWKVWKSLKQVFPSAIEHKVDRMSYEKSDHQCRACLEEEESNSALVKKLEKWGKDILDRDERLLSSIYNEPRKNLCHFVLERIAADADRGRPVDNEKCALIDKRDLQLWRDIVGATKSAKQKKFSEANSLKNHIEKLLSGGTALQYDTWSQLLARAMRPLQCERHKKTIGFAVFQDLPDRNSNLDDKHLIERKLSNRVELLPEEHYIALTDSFQDLVNILSSDSKIIDLSDEGPRLQPLLQHPTVHLLKSHYPDDFGEQFSLRSGKHSLPFELQPPLCKLDSCLQKFKAIDDFNEEKTTGFAADDPIVVGSDTEDAFLKDTFRLKVYEVEDKKSMDEGLASVLQLQTTNGVGENDGLRRSSRTRKSKFPLGALIREDSVQVGLHHNVAALRLFLYEKCDPFPVDQKLVLVVFQNQPEGSGNVDVIELMDSPETARLAKEREPSMIDLDFETNKESLQDVYNRLTQGSDPNLEQLGDPSVQLVLLHQSNANGDGAFTKDAVMDSLLAMANSISSPQGKDSSDAKGSKRLERGFRGTFLSRPAARTNKRDGGKGESDRSTSSKGDEDDTILADDSNVRALKRTKLCLPEVGVSETTLETKPKARPMAEAEIKDVAKVDLPSDFDEGDRAARIARRIMVFMEMGDDCQEKCWIAASSAVEKNPTWSDDDIFTHAAQSLWP